MLLAAGLVAPLLLSSPAQTGWQVQPPVAQSTSLDTLLIRKIAFQEANGRDVTAAWYGQKRFQKSGDEWLEINESGATTARFKEQSRDDWSVYLFDASRNVYIQLDLYTQKVMYKPGDGEYQPLYNLTRVSADAPAAAPAPAAPSKPASTVASVAEATAVATAILPVNNVVQCVKAKFGIGYVARVNWYQPQNMLLDEVTSAMTLRPGAKADKTEKIAVTEKSCITSKKRMVATVSAVGGESANTFISIAAGTIVAAGTGIAGAFVCVGTVGVGCPAAVAGVSAVAGGTVSAVGAALPDAGGMFYIGAPGSLEVSGTVWKPSSTEVQAWGAGKAINASCSSDSECANNTCARDSARDGNRSICCPSGKEGMYAAHEYCYQLPRDKVCWSDAMCSSGNCKGNMNGLQRGKCS
ncbi:hypothetical protein [Mesorhizobium sp. 10J20-29]